MREEGRRIGRDNLTRSVGLWTRTSLHPERGRKVRELYRNPVSKYTVGEKPTLRRYKTMFLCLVTTF